MLAGVTLDPAVRATVETALQSRHYERAEAVLLDQHNANPTSAPLLVLLGRVFFLDGKYENCAIALKKAEKSAAAGSPAFHPGRWRTLPMRHPVGMAEIEKLAQANPTKTLYPYWSVAPQSP